MSTVFRGDENIDRILCIAEVAPYGTFVIRMSEDWLRQHNSRPVKVGEIDNFLYHLENGNPYNLKAIQFYFTAGTEYNPQPELQIRAFDRIEDGIYVDKDLTELDREEYLGIFFQDFQTAKTSVEKTQEMEQVEGSFGAEIIYLKNIQ